MGAWAWKQSTVMATVDEGSPPSRPEDAGLMAHGLGSAE